MKNVLLTICLLFCIASYAMETNSPKQLTVTEVAHPDNQKEKILIIESDDPATLAQFDEVIAQYPELKQLEHANSESTKNLRVVYKNTEFIEKKDATRDCLLGVGLCLGGILFVQAAGEEYDDANPPQGIYANVGTKYVDGGAGCLVASIWVGGLVFGIKGIIEIFSKGDKSSAMIENWSTDEILDKTSLVELDKKKFEIENASNINQKVMPYLLVKTWL